MRGDKIVVEIKGRRLHAQRQFIFDQVAFDWNVERCRRSERPRRRSFHLQQLIKIAKVYWRDRYLLKNYFAGLSFRIPKLEVLNVFSEFVIADETDQQGLR